MRGLITVVTCVSKAEEACGKRIDMVISDSNKSVSTVIFFKCPSVYLMSRRCLIVGCSRTKVSSSQPLAAIELYDGPAFRVVRRYLGQAPKAVKNVDIFVLSAEFGLISAETKISSYDRLMNAARAAELRPSVLEAVRAQICPQNYTEVFLSMGKTYVQAMEGVDALLGDGIRVIISDSASGQKLTELQRWLWGVESQPTRITHNNEPPAQLKLIAEEVVLRGRHVQMTTEQAITELQSHLDQGDPVAFQLRDWYLDIVGRRVSPKWAASRLFGAPVREFSADEARRALKALGLDCHRVQADTQVFASNALT